MLAPKNLSPKLQVFGERPVVACVAPHGVGAFATVLFFKYRSSFRRQPRESQAELHFVRHHPRVGIHQCTLAAQLSGRCGGVRRGSQVFEARGQT